MSWLLEECDTVMPYMVINAYPKHTINSKYLLGFGQMTGHEAAAQHRAGAGQALCVPSYV